MVLKQKLMDLFFIRAMQWFFIIITAFFPTVDVGVSMPKH